MTIDTLLPLPEVGRLLGGFSEKTVRRMIDRGELPRPVKVRRRPMLPTSVVSAVIERLKNSSSNSSK